MYILLAFSILANASPLILLPTKTLLVTSTDSARILHSTSDFSSTFTSTESASIIVSTSSTFATFIPQSTIADWETCPTPATDVCSDEFICCVAPADIDIEKFTCRPKKDDFQCSFFLQESV
jgi:hypothetical protein